MYIIIIVYDKQGLFSLASKVNLICVGIYYLYSNYCIGSIANIHLLFILLPCV